MDQNYGVNVYKYQHIPDQFSGDSAKHARVDCIPKRDGQKYKLHNK